VQPLEQWAVANAEANGEMSLEQLLASIVSLPAPPQLHHVPAMFESRYASLLRDLLGSHADAEIEMHKRRSMEAEMNTIVASQKLWAFNAAVLYMPRQTNSSGDRGSNARDAHTEFDTVDVIRKRLQLAETGQWLAFYKGLCDAQQSNQTVLHEGYVQQVLADMGGLDWIYSKVATKVKNTNINAAKQILIGQVAAPHNSSTAQQIDSLVAEEIPESEANALRESIAKTQTETRI
jgi:hypothetical protein